MSLLFPLSYYSRDAAITDILIMNDANNITVYARVTNCFTKKMESAILAGVPMTFTYLLELYQEQINWFDKKINEATAKQTIKYDNVKKKFYVFTEDHKLFGFDSFDNAKKAMADLNGVAVASTKDMQKGENYRLKIKVKLDRVTLPMDMEYVFFFVSLWDFETGWYQQKFVYDS